MNLNWTNIRIAPGSPEELRRFGMVMGLLVLGIFGGLLPWWFSYPLPVWPWLLAVPLMLGAILRPPLLARPYIGWMVIGHVMGWLNTQIILLLMFYLIILPAGLVFRLGKGSNHKTARTYRQPKEKRDPTHMEHPY